MVVAEYSTGTQGFGKSDGPQSTDPWATHNWAVKLTVVAEMLDVIISYVTLGSKGNRSTIEVGILVAALPMGQLTERKQKRKIHPAATLMMSIEDDQTLAMWIIPDHERGLHIRPPSGKHWAPHEPFFESVK